MTAHPVRWVGECERCGVLLDEHDTQEAAEADAENCPCQSAEEPAAGSTPPPLTSWARGLLALIRVHGEAGHAVYPAAFAALGELERAGLVTVEWNDTGPVLAYPTGQAVWMMSPGRWKMSHLIVTAGTGEAPKYANAACGARVNLGRLEPEPTGMDTVDRCSSCRRRASKYGADDEPVIVSLVFLAGWALVFAGVCVYFVIRNRSGR